MALGITTITNVSAFHTSLPLKNTVSRSLTPAPRKRLWVAGSQRVMCSTTGVGGGPWHLHIPIIRVSPVTGDHKAFYMLPKRKWTLRCCVCYQGDSL